jgi:hypothetical protein
MIDRIQAAILLPPVRPDAEAFLERSHGRSKAAAELTRAIEAISSPDAQERGPVAGKGRSRQAR